MKKCTVFILALSIVFSFIGCNTHEDDTYTSFIADSANDGYSMKPEADYWTGLYFEKENMTNKTCHVLGNSYTGEYSKSIIDRMNSYTTDIYYDKNRIEFGLRSDTGELAYINFMNTDFFDTQPYLPEVNNPKETANSLATEIASKFVDNIDDYTQIAEEPRTRYKEKDGVTYEITYYTFTFAKKISGYFSSDYIAVKVTSKGTLASMMMGDINAFADVPLDFDTAAMDQSISNKIESAYKESPLTVKKSTADDQKIVLTPNGDIAMYSNIVVGGVDDSGMEVQTEVGILTILGKKPNR